MFGLGVDYLVMAFAPSVGWLFAGRILAGILGASITTANACIADILTRETGARNYGLINVAFGIGFMLGPALGGLLGGIDIRLPFFAAAVLCLANSAHGLFVLPESLEAENRRPSRCATQTRWRAWLTSERIRWSQALRPPSCSWPWRNAAWRPRGCSTPATATAGTKSRTAWP